MSDESSHREGLRELGIAAGLMAIILFGILYWITGHPAALIAGSGGGLVLLVVSLLSKRR